MKAKTSSKPAKRKKKAEVVQLDEATIIRYFQQNEYGNELVEKLFSTLIKKQQLTNRQIEESERKYNQQVEANNRLIEESTQKFLQQREGKNRQLEVIDAKISQQLTNNKYRSGNDEDLDSGKSQKNKKANSGSSALAVDDAVIKLFRKKGYAIHGAIVGNDFTDAEKQEIFKAGFFLIEQYGKSFILNIPDEFVPKKI